MTSFTRYKAIKDKFSFRFHRIDLAPLMSTTFISYCYGHIDVAELTFSQFKRGLRSIKTYQSIGNHFSAKKVLLSYSPWKRPDYIEFVDQYAAMIPNSSTLSYEFTEVQRLNWSDVLVSTFQIFISLFRDFNFKQCLNLVVQLVEIKAKIRTIENAISKDYLQAFIAFNSSTQEDAIMTLVLKKHKIPTYSLQHGFYLNYRSWIPLDVINFENFNANYLLCWGESTKSNMLDFGISEDKLLVVGNPRFDLQKEMKVSLPKFKYGLVLFGRDVHHQSNIELLDILKKLAATTEIDFALKLHPSLYLKGLDGQYDVGFPLLDKDSNLAEVVDSGKFDFAISNNTTAYFDILIKGLLCFRYTAKETEPLGHDHYVFNSADEFKMVQDDCLKKSEETIKANIEETLKRNFYTHTEQKLKELFLRS